MGCSNVRAELTRAFGDGQGLSGNLTEHLGGCADCRTFAMSLVVASGTKEGCPGGYELASFVAGEAGRGELTAVGAHLPFCEKCREVVQEMMVLKRKFAGVRAEVPDEETAPVAERIHAWGEVADEVRRSLRKWVHQVVSEQFWIPVPQVVGAIEGLSEASEVVGGHAADCEVLDVEGDPVIGLRARIMAPPIVGRDGVLRAKFRLAFDVECCEGSLTLFVDLHGRGILQVGPERALKNQSVPQEMTLVSFEAAGFEKSAVRIPEEEYSLVFEPDGP